MKGNGNNIRTLKHLAAPPIFIFICPPPHLDLLPLFVAYSGHVPEKRFAGISPPEARNRLSLLFINFPAFCFFCPPNYPNVCFTFQLADGILIKLVFKRY